MLRNLIPTVYKDSASHLNAVLIIFPLYLNPNPHPSLEEPKSKTFLVAFQLQFYYIPVSFPFSGWNLNRLNFTHYVFSSPLTSVTFHLVNADVGWINLE